MAGLAFALAPLAIHQTRALGRLQLLTLNGGLNLYLGNNPWARGLYSVPPGIDLEQDITAARSASILAHRELGLADADRFFAARARTFLREEPGRAAWLWARKALLYLSPHEIPQIEYFDRLRADAGPLRVAFVDFRWILPLAVLGVAGALRSVRRRRTSWGGGAPSAPRLAPWLLLVAVGWLSTIVFFATGRYRVPFLPGFLGLAGLGVAMAAGWVRDRRLPWIGLVVPVVVGAQFLLPGFPRNKAASFDAYQLGIRLAQVGRYAEALDAYHEAARFWPDSGEAWHGIGASLVRLGRPAEAVTSYEQALQRMPDSAVTHYNLGAVLGRMGEDARALAQFREAVSLDPYEPSYRSDLAVALARTGQRDAAIREFRRVLEAHPEHAGARRGLEALTGGGGSP